MVCGGLPSALGCFLPYDLERYSAVKVPEESIGVVLYSLCRLCLGLPPDLTNDRVEAALRLLTTAARN